MRRLRTLAYTLLTLSLVGGALVALPFVLRMYTSLHYDGHIYTAATVPENEVAIIFGAQVMPSGRPSAMLYDRIMTGVDLYQQGKVQVLLMSGDSHVPEYNETAAMKRVAMQQGVPEDAILLDPLGLRTFDSCQRARDEFGYTSAILITQAFHLDRALMLCDQLGLDAVGVAADYQRPWGYSERSMRWSQWREVAATSIAFLDVVRWRIGL